MVNSFIPTILRRYNWAFALSVGLLTLGIAGCTASDIERTRVGQEMRNSQSDTAKGVLGDAVFSVTQDMTIDEAILTLSSDGALCRETTCTWTFTDKDTMWDKMGARPPGPLRTWIKVYSVEFTSAIILDRADVLSNVTSTQIK